jgi:hypothetical protein
MWMPHNPAASQGVGRSEGDWPCGCWLSVQHRRRRCTASSQDELTGKTALRWGIRGGVRAGVCHARRSVWQAGFRFVAGLVSADADGAPGRTAPRHDAALALALDSACSGSTDAALVRRFSAIAAFSRDRGAGSVAAARRRPSYLLAARHRWCHSLAGSRPVASRSSSTRPPASLPAVWIRRGTAGCSTRRCPHPEG